MPNLPVVLVSFYLFFQVLLSPLVSPTSSSVSPLTSSPTSSSIPSSVSSAAFSFNQSSSFTPSTSSMPSVFFTVRNRTRLPSTVANSICFAFSSGAYSRWYGFEPCFPSFTPSAFFALFAPSVQPVYASNLSENPKTESVTVSAKVADNEAPTTPILISPQDGDTATTGYITFIWQRSTDSNGIKEYQLLIDGSAHLTQIPTNDHETGNYKLTYDSSSEHLTLTLKSPLADGAHTWKIRALDNLNNGTNSATWSFTIDTQAPSFVLTDVGSLKTSISAQDLSTIPDKPLELEDNEPQLLANGEANSTVELLVTIPDDPSQSFTNTTDGNGNWGQQLGILPRGTVMTLDFTITDQAGLVSVLHGVEFLIKQKVITYPAASPEGVVGPVGVSPAPGVSPTPGRPTKPLPAPLISIPLTPPIEIAHEIIQESFEHLPQPMKAIVAAVPAETRGYLAAEARQVAPILALLVLILLALLVPLALLRRFGRQLSPHLFYRGLQALHLWPSAWSAANFPLPLPQKNNPQGLIYDSQTQAPVPFALVELWQEDALVNSVLSDKNGFYTGLNLPPGQYKFKVSHPDYHFPARQDAPVHLNDDQFYQGQYFVLNESKTQAQTGFSAQTGSPALKLIPLDLIRQKQPAFRFSRLNPIPALPQLANFYSFIFLPTFVLIGLIAIIFPTTINLATFAFYLAFVLKKAFAWFRPPSLRGTVIGQDGRPLENALVEIFAPGNLAYLALLQADADGQFVASREISAEVSAQAVGDLRVTHLFTQKPVIVEHG